MKLIGTQVKCRNALCHSRLRLMHAGLSDDLWRNGYRLNDNMRPSFISKQMAGTILRAGKSINFLRYHYICKLVLDHLPLLCSLSRLRAWQFHHQCCDGILSTPLVIAD